MADQTGNSPQVRRQDDTASISTSRISSTHAEHSGSPESWRSSRGVRYHAHRFLRGIGLVTVYNSPVDAKLILAQRFVRVFAYGLVALNLAAYLAALGISETQIGVFFGLTLVGDLFMVMLLTQFAHVVGLKVVLVTGAVLMTASGLVFACSDDYRVLLAAAVFGVISPSATEVGPFKSIEESALFTLVTHNIVDVLSWYGTAEFTSIAVGVAVSASITDYLQRTQAWSFVSACRAIFLLYATIGVLKIILSSCLSHRIEPWHHRDKEGRAVQDAEQQPTPSSSAAEEVHEPLLAPTPSIPVPPASKQGYSVFSLDKRERLILLKVCTLMAFDACAVGLSSVPWQTYFVRTGFDVPTSQLGTIFFISNMLAAAGTISSSALARRMGNMITLAVTYYPAAIIMLFFGLPDTISILLVLILVEGFLSVIYVAPRNALIGRILTPSKRVASLGVMNLVKMTTNASGSFLTGVLADRDMFWLVFVLAGALKIVYVTGMLYTFLAVDRRMTRDENERAHEAET
ncbi:hypothetical protein LTR53_008786 [Teratosphaeriaceae sp. CCFEE 6253]|nr:hypothetical protein LTR53_008786 [Teratosphaeriaceae sp. CCFEE 6253]